MSPPWTGSHNCRVRIRTRRAAAIRPFRKWNTFAAGSGLPERNGSHSGAGRFGPVLTHVPRVALAGLEARKRAAGNWKRRETIKKMPDIQYLAPRTLDEAVKAFAATEGARIMAGGTDLLVQMRAGVLKPGLIVDIKKIAETTAIERTADGGFRIGAAVSGAALAEHPEFGKAWPGVLEGINLIGSKQVQGRASAGGNLCNGSPAGDSVPALVAAGAIVTVRGPNGERQLPVEQVPAGPGKTHLRKGEIVVSFTLPARPQGASDAYLRMIPRTEMDIAVVGLGVSLTLENGVCKAARVGLGAVAPTVLLAKDAADALIGSNLDDAALEKAAAACRAACRPIDDKRGTIVYRTKVAGVLLKRAVAVAAQRAGGI